MEALADVGLILKSGKTLVLTNETQPPTHLHAQSREQIQVKTGNSGRMWLGCIPGVSPANRSSLDLQHHLRAASRVFSAHKQLLCDQRVRVKDRLRFFDIVITPVAMSGSGHRTVYQPDFCRMDVLFRSCFVSGTRFCTSGT